MALLIGLIIGSILGLTGAGGSVLAVPLLIMLMSFPVKHAIGFAMGVVAVSALYGSVNHWRCKTVLWVPAFLLAGTGALTSPLGNWLRYHIPDFWLLAGFSLLACIIAVRVWRQTNAPAEDRDSAGVENLPAAKLKQLSCRINPRGQFEWRPRCVAGLVMGGLTVGLLTGLFGVGGGFLIVPLLLLLSEVSMVQAVGTSLLVITIVSGIGFASYLMSAGQVDWVVLGTLAIGGLGGMYVGQLLSVKWEETTLQKVFSFSLIVVSILTLINVSMVSHA